MQITGIQFNIRKTQKRQVGYVEIIWQLRISKWQKFHIGLHVTVVDVHESKSGQIVSTQSRTKIIKEKSYHK